MKCTRDGNCDFKLMARCNGGLRSSGMLQVVDDVAGQPIGPVLEQPSSRDRYCPGKSVTTNQR